MLKASALSVVLLLSAAANAADDTNLESLFGELPLGSDVHLSPDGNSLAMITGSGGRNAFEIWSLDGSKPTYLPVSVADKMQTEPYEANWIAWKTNKRLITGVAVGDLIDEVPQTQTRSITVDADGQDPRTLSFDHVSRHDLSSGAVHQGGILLPDPRGRPIASLTDVEQRNFFPQFQDRVVSLLPGDPDHVLMAVTVLGDELHPAVLQVNVHSGVTQSVVKSQLDVTNWMADPAGKVRLGIALPRNDATRRIYARLDGDSEWNLIREDVIDVSPLFNPLAFAADNPSILYVSITGESGFLEIREFDITRKSIGKTIAADPNGDALPVFRDGALIGYRIDGGQPVYLDRQWEETEESVRHAVPGYDVALIDRSDDAKRYLVLASKRNEPPIYLLLDRRGSKTRLSAVLATYPDQLADHVAASRIITYQNRDGRTIAARLTLPIGAKPGPIPFVVLPHDGPALRDQAGFDWLAQYIASLGVGVLQPEYRGSGFESGDLAPMTMTPYDSGSVLDPRYGGVAPEFGTPLARAGYRQWGAAMQDDLTDGTRWLAEQGYADRRRICIVGSGYGGYAALMGGVREPGLYRCIAALAPIADLQSYIDLVQRQRFHGLLLARIEPADGSVSAHSPLDNAGKVGVPVLLVHGRMDVAVPVAFTERMERALAEEREKVGIVEISEPRSAVPSTPKPPAVKRSVKAIYLDKADHMLSRADDRTAFLAALGTFLRANLLDQQQK
jgi:dipeptidyl aminopeptidase/acylaminoacyl peptidase